MSYDFKSHSSIYPMPKSRSTEYTTLEPILTQAFISQPILGDINLDQCSKDLLYSIANEAISNARTINSDGLSDFHSDIVVFATVLLLRNWNDNEKNENGNSINFWEFIFNQYALPFDDVNLANSTEYKIFRNSIEKSLTRHKKFMATHGHRFYTTMLTHALAPKSKFYDLFEQIFAFYAKTLRYHYIKNDPAFHSFVRVMRARFERGSTRSDDDIYIKSVQSSSAIKALFQYCPEYICELIEHIVYNIDTIITNGHIRVNTYLDELLSKWYHSRNRDVRTNDKKERTKESKERVVTEFSNIRPIYRLENGRVLLFIPSIRFGEDDGAEPWIKIYQSKNNESLYSARMDCYGSHICRTSNKLEIPIESLLTANSERFELRVIISYGSKDIYDSSTKLYRDAIAFDYNGGEISKRPNDVYVNLFVPECATVTGKDTTPDFSITRSSNGLLYRILIDDNTHVVVNGVSLFPVVKIVSGLTINKSVAPLDFCKYKIEHYDCDIYTKCPTLAFSSTEPLFFKMFRLEVDGKSYSLEQCFDDVQNQYCITLPGSAGVHHFQIVDNTKQSLVYTLSYVVIEDITIRFRGFYYFEDWEQNGTVEITTSEETKQSLYSLLPEEELMIVPHERGEFLIDIPRLNCRIDESEIFTDSELVIWHEDISMSSLLEVCVPRGYSGNVFVGSTPFDSDKIEIGNVIKAKQNQDIEAVGIILRKPDEPPVEIKLLDIAFKPFFKSIPIVEESDALLWYAGDNFIGSDRSEFKLSIMQQDIEVGLYTLNSTDNEAVLDKHFSNGSYSFVVYMKKPGFFNSMFEELHSGTFVVGDPAQYRFANNAIIVTEAITESYKHPLNYASGIIVNLKYKGKHFLNGEVQPYPLYEGQLMFKHKDTGKLHPYATEDFVDKKGRQREQINPVKVWIINDYTLSLRSPTDDGLYIYKSLNSITDRAPHNTHTSETDYCNPEYYSYKIITHLEVSNV